MQAGQREVEQSFEPIHGGGRVFRLILDVVPSCGSKVRMAQPGFRVHAAASYSGQRRACPGIWTSDWRAQLYSKGVIAIREGMSSILN